jgi:hypothetical protein
VQCPSTEAGESINIISVKAKCRIKTTDLSKDLRTKESGSHGMSGKRFLKPFGSTPRRTLETLNQTHLNST